MNSKLTYVAISVCVAGLLGFFLKMATGCNLLVDMASLALIFTLAILILYTYYTYKIASEAWTPVASFWMEQDSLLRYTVKFQIQNHCKFPLECWCNINPSVCGQNVRMEGFYGEKKSWILIPFIVGSGYFEVSEILQKVGKTVQDMKQMAGTVDVKKQLTFEVDFYYYRVGKKKERISYPVQPYYFDFVRDVLVLDF